ncbi:MAG: hypothetical protein IBX64_09595 [Actinobacteria bacterium]|nr:hypothetical protein [Actinomycetota bacterium]
MTSTQDFSWSSLAKLYKRFISDMIQVISNPQADAQTTILILIILSLLIAIFALLVWLIASSIFKKKRAATGVLISKHFETTSREMWTIRILFIVAVFISLTAIFYFGNQSSVCTRCHGGDLSKNVKKSTHSKVACVSCHRSPGIDGHVTQLFDYIRWLSKFTVAKNQKGSYDARVVNASCLGCHKRVAKETIVRWSVRVRHADFLAAGARCTDCHGSIAHGEALAIVREPSMDKCVMCHDNESAPADCNLCHTSEASPTTRKMPEEIIRIDADPMRNCRGCHPQTPQSECVRCHGLEMPHPEGWVGRPGIGPNKHARQGFLDKKLCKRCHKFDETLPPVGHATDSVYMNKIFCNRCHAYTSPHGSTERWLKMHGPIALGRVISNNSQCGKCHSSDFEQKCMTCHGGALCDACHQDGRRGK